MKTTRRSILVWLVLLTTVMYGLRAESASTTKLNNQAPTASNPIAAYGESVAYDIFRKNKKIGTHTLRFSAESDKTLVKIESKIIVTVLKIPVYRFNYQSTETWIKGLLQTVTASTDDNGDKYQVSAKRSGKTMLLSDKRGATYKSNVAHASNHWNSQVLDADILFNTLTGKANKVVVNNLGTETLTVNNDQIQATHYRLAGDLKTDVWYDSAGRWVQLRFIGKDGNAIEYRCKGFKL